MKKMKKLVITGCAVLSLMSVSFLASAEEHTGWGCKDKTNRAECMHAQMDKMQEKRLEKLHDHLKITAEQEPAWKSFVDGMKKMRPGMMHDGMAMHHDEKDGAAIPSAPELITRHLAMLKQQEARLTEFAPVLTAFYAQLTPEQKKMFDAHHAHEMQQSHHWGHHDKD
jgi:Spy/CpxP family protein refolding chaperone